MSVPATLPLTITNASGQPNSSIYVYVIGLNAPLDDGGVWAHLKADGSFKPIALSDNGPDGYTDYALELKPTGTTTFHIPPIWSGQVYFAFSQKLKIQVNSNSSQPGGLGWTAPSGWTPTDPNYNTIYADVEFTYQGGGGAGGMNCDTTYVDMFSVPLTIELVGSLGTQTAGGVTASRSDIFAAFTNAGAPLSTLVVGSDVRILNPMHAIGVTGFPSNYLDSAISAAWTQYQTQTLTVTVSGESYSGTVDASTNDMSFQGVSGSIAQPTTLQTLSCNGPFVPADSTLAAIAAAVAAALNRGTLATATQPVCNASQFYQGTSNGYAQLMHQYSTDGQCYAFPYDDVCNLYSSDLADPEPTQWNVTVNAF